MINNKIRIRHHQYDSRNINKLKINIIFQRNLRHHILELPIDGYVNLKTKKKLRQSIKMVQIYFCYSMIILLIDYNHDLDLSNKVLLLERINNIKYQNFS